MKKRAKIVTKRAAESALDKVLKHHARHCTYWIFSGDRHCSCGRDAALVELAALRLPNTASTGLAPDDESKGVIDRGASQ